MSAHGQPEREAETLPEKRNRYSTSQRVMLALVPPVATLFLRVLGSTLRFRDMADAQAFPADQTDRADIYAFWHRCLLLAAYRYRNLGIRILISQSFDGELIARIVQRLGFVPVRGSSSRGGAAGLLALSRALAEGHKVAITVDGPKGPAYQVKPGAASVAMRQVHRKVKADIASACQSVSPFYLHPSRCWTLGSWDRFLIPKPFSRVTCAWPELIAVSNVDSAEFVNTRLQAALDAAVSCAESS